MPQNRVKFSNIVQNQLPDYVQDEFPLVAEFLKSYYQGQEYQSGPLDLIQNIDQYIKVSKLTNLTHSVILGTSLGYSENEVTIDLVISDGQSRVLKSLETKTKKAIKLYDNLTKNVNQKFIINNKEFNKEIIKPNFI